VQDCATDSNVLLLLVLVPCLGRLLLDFLWQKFTGCVGEIAECVWSLCLACCRKRLRRWCCCAKDESEEAERAAAEAAVAARLVAMGLSETVAQKRSITLMENGLSGTAELETLSEDELAEFGEFNSLDLNKVTESRQAQPHPEKADAATETPDRPRRRCCERKYAALDEGEQAPSASSISRRQQRVAATTAADSTLAGLLVSMGFSQRAAMKRAAALRDEAGASTVDDFDLLMEGGLDQLLEEGGFKPLDVRRVKKFRERAAARDAEPEPEPQPQPQPQPEPDAFTMRDLASPTTYAGKWARAQEGNRISPGGALLRGGARGLLWHVLQPVLYFLVFAVFSHELDSLQFVLGAAVGVREAVYLLLTVVCMFVNPAFLIVSVGASVEDNGGSGGASAYVAGCGRYWEWRKDGDEDTEPEYDEDGEPAAVGARPWETGCSFLLLYVLSPEKYVAFALLAHRETLQKVVVFGGILLDLCGVGALGAGIGTGVLPRPLAIGYTVSALSAASLACWR
jgi:hypothetical protein